jgi:hypothetical protein
MLIKCAFVGHKNFDIYRNARYYNNKNGNIMFAKVICSINNRNEARYVSMKLMHAFVK